MELTVSLFYITLTEEFSTETCIPEKARKIHKIIVKSEKHNLQLDKEVRQPA